VQEPSDHVADDARIAVAMRVSQLKKEVDERFALVDARFAQVDARFDRVDARLAQIDARFEEIEKRMAADGEATRRYVDERIAADGEATRRYVDERIAADGEATRRYVDERTAAEGEATRRHFDVVHEKFKAELRLMYDKNAATDGKISSHEQEHDTFKRALDDHEVRLKVLEGRRQ